MSIADAIVALVAGALAGAYAGLLGIGGGIVMVPAMVLFLDQSQHVAQGTSLLVIIVTALAAVRVHRRRGLVNARWARLLAVGGVLGAVVGSALAVWMVHNEQALRRIFGWFLLAVATWLVARAVFMSRAGSAEAPAPGGPGA